MFHFADFAPYRVSRLLWKGCPIRIFADQWPLAPPRNVSPLATSFFAVRCHGIPRMLFHCLFSDFITALYSFVNMLRVIYLLTLRIWWR